MHNAFAFFRAVRAHDDFAGQFKAGNILGDRQRMPIRLLIK
tara:strand:+ start:5889 stop:6011 length:123 start_codon:yes stop_codon:yes gene_type:complete